MQKGRLSPLDKRLTQSEYKIPKRYSYNFAQQVLTSHTPEIKEAKRERSVWEDLQSELEKRNSTLYALQRNYEGLSKVVTEKYTREEEVHKKLEELISENQKLKQTLNQLDHRFKVLKRQNNSLQDQNSSMSRLYEENAKLQVELRSVKGTLDLKISEVEQLEEIIKKYRFDTASISKMTIESDSQSYKLRREIQEMNSRGEIIENQVKFLEDEKKHLEQDLQILKSEIDELKDKYRFSLRREEELEAQILPMKKRMNEEVKEVEKARNNLVRAVGMYQELQKDYDYKKTMLATKLSMEQELMKKLNLLEKQTDYLKQENSELQSQIQRERKERESMHVKFEELKLNSDHIMTAIELESENSQLSIEQVRQKLINTEKDYEKLLKDHKVTQNALQLEIDALTRKYSLLSSEHQDLKKNFFKEKSELLTKHLEQLNNITEKKENKMMHKVKPVIKLSESRMSRTSTPLLIRREDLNISPSSIATSRVENPRIKKIQALNSSLTLKCKELKAANKDITSAKETLEKECQHLQFTITDLMKGLEAKDSEIKNLKHNLDHNFEANRLKELILSKESEIHSLRSELHNSRSEYSNLFNLLQEEGKSKNSYDLNLELLKNIEKLKKELEYYRPSTEQLMLELKQIREKEKIFKEKVDQMNQSLLQVVDTIKCNLCYKPVKNAIVCIPCGHHYCKKCKKGYREECVKCKGVRGTLRLNMMSQLSESTESLVSCLDEINRLLIS